QAAHYHYLEKISVWHKKRNNDREGENQQVKPFFLKKFQYQCRCHLPWTSLPNNPVGLMASIKTSAPNANTSLYAAETYPPPRASINPKITPPTIAPGKLPRPPRITMTNAFMPTISPMLEVSTNMGATRQAAIDASPIDMAKVI